MGVSAPHSSKESNMNFRYYVGRRGKMARSFTYRDNGQLKSKLGAGECLNRTRPERQGTYD